MIKMDVILLDKLNNIKEEIQILKYKSFKLLINQIKRKFKNISQYFEIFILSNNENEIKISNERDYKLVEDKLFVRETDQDILEQSMFEINYEKSSEENRDMLDDNYTCKICCMIIKDEKPYFCYNCQKIFHQQCLKDWDKQAKSQNILLYCPHCRNALPIEKWRKKLDYEDNRKQIANLMNIINNKRENNYINIINNKEIKELKEKNNKQHELINKYEKYIEKTIIIFKNILNQINLIKFTLKIKNNYITNNKLNDLINKYPLNIQNLKIDNISNVIMEELEQLNKFNMHLLNINNANEIMIDYNKMMGIIKKEKGKGKVSNNNKQINIKENNKENNIMEKLGFEMLKLTNKYKNKINLIYKAFRQDEYQIFGEQFVINNKDNIELIINGQAN